MIRLGAVGYLNARPHVYGLEDSPQFAIRFDVPSRCAELLHEHEIDVGLIPSIEYLRGPEYRIVPGVAIASRGAVRSVALYTTRPIRDVRSIALDTSSRSSVALMRVLCARTFQIRPRFEPSGPDLESMLARCHAAVLIGDTALFLNEAEVRLHGAAGLEKIDLGEVWTQATGLPFVYAFWAGRAAALTPDAVGELQAARDRGVAHAEEIARAYVTDPRHQAIGARYLRDNIKYGLGADERAALELFYRYAVEVGVVRAVQELRFF
jgi:chorismate dehydratase